MSDPDDTEPPTYTDEELAALIRAAIRGEALPDLPPSSSGKLAGAPDN